MGIANWSDFQPRNEPSASALSRHPVGSFRNRAALEGWVGRAEVLFEMRGRSSAGWNACLSRRRPRVRVPSLPPASPQVSVRAALKFSYRGHLPLAMNALAPAAPHRAELLLASLETRSNTEQEGTVESGPYPRLSLQSACTPSIPRKLRR